MSMPFYKRYPRDFFEGTSGMNFEIKGAYSMLLDMIFMLDGMLPDDPRYISGLMGMSVRKWNVTKSKLIDLGKITHENGYLYNARATEIIEERGHFSHSKKKGLNHQNKRSQDNPEIISRSSQDNPEIISRSSQDKLEINEGEYNKNKELKNLPHASARKPEPKPEPERDEKSPGGRAREPVFTSQSKQPLSHLPDDALDQCLKAASLDRNALAGRAGLANFSMIANLTRPPPPGIAQAPPCDFTLDVLPAVQACAASLAARGETMQSWKYCQKAILKTRDQRLTPIPKVKISNDSYCDQNPSRPRRHPSAQRDSPREDAFIRSVLEVASEGGISSH